MQISVTDLRRDLFGVLKKVSYEGRPVEVCLRGRTVAVISPPPARAGKPTINRRRIARLCRRYGVRQLALFGSITRDDFGPDSDVDVLYEPALGADFGLDEYSGLLAGLRDIFGRSVDLLRRSAVEADSNPIWKKAILEGAEVIYGS